MIRPQEAIDKCSKKLRRRLSLSGGYTGVYYIILWVFLYFTTFQNKKQQLGLPGWLRLLSVPPLISAQVMDPAPRQAPRWVWNLFEILSLPLSVSPHWAQSVDPPTLDFGFRSSSHGSWVWVLRWAPPSPGLGSRPAVWSLPGILSHSLSLCPSPTHPCALFLSLKMNKFKIK